jgi:Subtilase family
MNEESREGKPRWRDRIAVSQANDGFAYVPGHVLVRDGAEQRAEELTGRPAEERPDLRRDKGSPLWRRVTGVEDPLAVVGVLRSEGLDAQPEHVFFAHGCSPCEHGPHPSTHMGAPDADPYRANPYRANPYRANPYRANPYRANEAPLSSAEPALHPTLPPRPVLAGPGAAPRILVLDTGLAGDGQCPPLLDAAPRIEGALDRPDDAIMPASGPPPFPPDGYLDPVAGHGTFIAGLIEQLAGGCTIEVQRVIEPLGDGRELDIVAALEAATALPDGDRPDIISMSFGGQVFEQAFALRSAIAAARLAGIVLVASAGNDGICTPQYPAAFDEVIGVAAVGPAGPPPWTNYGEWVDACAPGVELVSAFFANFDGAFPMMNSVDIDKFVRWACWSGSSFSGPVVVAALAREMVVGDCGAAEAVQRVVHAGHLLRLPCLGTVVNL